MSRELKILVAGQGAREHALAWALAASPRVREVVVAPGNPGVEGMTRVRRAAEVASAEALVACAVAEGVDLVVIGPERLLADGLADGLAAAGVPTFGPRRAAAQIESSKVFARRLLQAAGVPGPRFMAFSELEAALEYVRGVDREVVIKADGLAQGKGVFVPEDRQEAEAAVRRLLEERALGEAGATIVIEERLYGPEVSLLALCDGQRATLLPAAQDAKRLEEGDRGPNTGGMGAVAPVLPASALPLLGSALVQPVLDALAARGTPFIGALYVGVMLTPEGPRVLECNARLGDPETQALLPLLDVELASVLLSCAQGRLEAPGVLPTRPGASAALTLAAAGYPAAARQGDPIAGLADAAASAEGIFHAGTARRAGGELVTAGGRVLSVVATGDDLAAALRRAYQAAACIHFEGMTLRRDIGRGAAACARALYAEE